MAKKQEKNIVARGKTCRFVSNQTLTLIVVGAIIAIAVIILLGAAR